MASVPPPARHPVSAVAERFERDTGSSEADWRRCLPEACGAHPWVASGPSSVRVHLDAGGTLNVAWRVLPPRHIGLICVARLWVSYRFEAVPAPARAHFMQHFDRVMQRGGG